MTVKELKEKLNEFNDNFIVLIPNIDWSPYGNSPTDVPARNVTRGVNEFDCAVFIDSYVEDDEEEMVNDDKS